MVFAHPAVLAGACHFIHLCFTGFHPVLYYPVAGLGFYMEPHLQKGETQDLVFFDPFIPRILCLGIAESDPCTKLAG